MFAYKIMAGNVVLGESNDLHSAQLLAAVHLAAGQPCRVVYSGVERRLPKTSYAKLRVELIETR